MATSTDAEDPALPVLAPRGSPFCLRTIPAESGKEFTDRFIARGMRTPTETHAFDEQCQALDPELVGEVLTEVRSRQRRTTSTR